MYDLGQFGEGVPRQNNNHEPVERVANARNRDHARPVMDLLNDGEPMAGVWRPLFELLDYWF
jgi:hypothetical protein